MKLIQLCGYSNLTAKSIKTNFSTLFTSLQKAKKYDLINPTIIVTKKETR